MPSLSGAVSICCSPTPVNLHRPFDGLPGLVRPRLGHDPPDGSLCVFLNRSLRMVKVLCREGDGLSIWSRRLGRGSSACPGTTPGTSGWRRASRRASWRAFGRSATAGGTAPSSDSRDFLCT